MKLDLDLVRDFDEFTANSGFPLSGDSELFDRIRTALKEQNDFLNRGITIGDLTKAHVFEPTGIKNLSDMQAVFDAVESALTLFAKNAKNDQPITATAAEQLTSLWNGIVDAQSTNDLSVMTKSEIIAMLSTMAGDGMVGAYKLGLAAQTDHIPDAGKMVKTITVDAIALEKYVYGGSSKADYDAAEATVKAALRSGGAA